MSKPSLSRTSSNTNSNASRRTSMSSMASASTAASSVSSAASTDTQGSFVLKTHKRRLGSTANGETVTQQLTDRIRYQGRRDRHGRVKPETLSIGISKSTSGCSSSKTDFPHQPSYADIRTVAGLLRVHPRRQRHKEDVPASRQLIKPKPQPSSRKSSIDAPPRTYNPTPGLSITTDEPGVKFVSAGGIPMLVTDDATKDQDYYDSWDFHSQTQVHRMRCGPECGPSNW